MKILRNAFTIASIFVLGGCQFFGNIHLAHNAPAAQPATAIASAPNSSWIRDGREHLHNNRTGLAIEAFNRALASGEDPAMAYNGLGVAYARLGRFDLGYRCFNKAIMSDPTNPIFARNLTSLVNSPAFTLDQMIRTPVLAAARPSPTELSAAAAAASRVPGKLYRDSNRQFSLVTAAPDEARAARGERNASREACVRARSARIQRQCRTIALPTVQSRTRKPALSAFNQAFPSSQVPIAAMAEQPVEVLKGQRKVVDLRSRQHSTPQEHMPQHIHTASNAAT